MIHHVLDDIGFPLAWSFMTLGGLVTWLADHGMGFFGIGLGCFGAVVQWKTYQLRRRLAEHKLGVEPGAEID